MTRTSPPQVMSQRLLPHRDLRRVQSGVRDRATVPRATVHRRRGLRRRRNRSDALQRIPRTSLSLPARKPVCWSVVVVSVR